MPVAVRSPTAVPRNTLRAAALAAQASSRVKSRAWFSHTSGIPEVVRGRSIGLDVHRDLCQVAIADGGRARSAGRMATTPERLELFARSLAPDDRVVIEATGNAFGDRQDRCRPIDRGNVERT